MDDLGGEGGKRRRSFFGWKRPEPLLAQVHSTLFGLVLHTVQDILDHSAIEMVGVGKIVMDLVPSSENNPTTNKGSASGSTVMERRQRRLQSFPVMTTTTFISGIGVGIVVTLIFQNYAEEIQDISTKFSKCILSLFQGIGSSFQQFRRTIFSRNKKTDDDDDYDGEDDFSGFYIAGGGPVQQVVNKKYPNIGI